MTLFIAGVNHFDPMGREHVANWLCSLADRNNVPPSFIAVELEKSIFSSLRSLRAHYRECIHQLWPGVPEADLDQFELSLGYEGDTHLECFHNTDVIWLDQDRALPPGTVETHVQQRLLALRYFESRNALMLPGVVSEQVQPYARANVFSVARSREFARRILDHVHTHPWRWGIAITGASHASDRFEESMRSLLESAGIRCETRIFCRLD